MLAALIAGIGLLLLLGLAGRWLTSIEPRRLLAFGAWLFALLGLLLLVGLVVTGRGAIVFGLLLMLLPFLRPLWRSLQAMGVQARAQGRAGDSASTLTTRTLRMSLDHTSGDLDGEVTTGAFAGRHLSELSLQELLQLMQMCAVSDSQSLPLLEAFADRRFPGWRESAPEPEGTGEWEGEGARAFSPESGRMTRDDAYQILGLAPGATEEDVRAAHHRLIKVLHPDRGGSSLLAAQVNRARDLLLGRDTSR